MSAAPGSPDFQTPREAMRQWFDQDTTRLKDLLLGTKTVKFASAEDEETAVVFACDYIDLVREKITPERYILNLYELDPRKPHQLLESTGK